jgi:hypothetical protein
MLGMLGCWDVGMLGCWDYCDVGCGYVETRVAMADVGHLDDPGRHRVSILPPTAIKAVKHAVVQETMSPSQMLQVLSAELGTFVINVGHTPPHSFSSFVCSFASYTFSLPFWLEFRYLLSFV